MTLRYSRHAIQRIVQRRISLDDVHAALAQPPLFREPKRTEEYRDPVSGVIVVVDPYLREIVSAMFEYERMP